MRNTTKLILSLVLLSHATFAQVAKTVVVEHFTNTLCSVCAARNPGFYNNLNSQNGVLHIAIHPSSPYASCLLNQHNKVENDARTNYYGLYGSTPRFVIQGEVIAANADINSQSLFNPYLEQTSPLEITTTFTEAAGQMLAVRVVVKTITSHNLPSLVLTTSVVEELLNYASPNGEQQQHDVFRKSCFDVNGQSFSAPATVGDSVVFTATVAKNTIWSAHQLYALTMIQEAGSKKVVQASRTPNLTPETGLNEAFMSEILLYPNPAGTEVVLKAENPENCFVTVYTISGQKMYAMHFYNEATIHTADFPNGIYNITVSNNRGSKQMKLVVIH